MDIIITGGAGFVGGNLACGLFERGHNVIAFDNLSRRGSESNVERFNKLGVRFIHGDTRDPDALAKLPPAAVVLDCASQTTAVDGYTDPHFDFTSNVIGAVNVLELCRKRGMGLVFWSTNKVYPSSVTNIPVEECETRYKWKSDEAPGWSPKGFNEDLSVIGGERTIYGTTKFAAETIQQEWSRAFGIPLVINRFSCLYGPHQFGKETQGWLTWLISARLEKRPVTFYGFDGKQVRDALYIDDLVDLVEKQVMSMPIRDPLVFNVGGGENNSISLVELWAKLGQLGLEEYDAVIASARRNDQVIFVTDITRVSKRYNWEPRVGLDEGIQNVIKWLKER